MNASSVSALKTSFQTASSVDSRLSVKTEKTKRPAPLSLRISAIERVSLVEAASGQPLNRYIRECLFDKKGNIRKRKRKSHSQDTQAIARILGLLAQSDMFRNLNVLVEKIDTGDIQLSLETEEQISVACACILLMRNDLIKALGLKSE